MALLLSPKAQKLRMILSFKKVQLILGITLAAFIWVLMPSLTTSPMLGHSGLQVDLASFDRFDTENPDTFQAKYLKLIKNGDLPLTEYFYDTWGVIGLLDELMNEGDIIEEVEERPWTDLYQLIENSQIEFSSMNIEEKADYYVNTLLPDSDFEFEAIDDVIYKDIYSSLKYIKVRLSKWINIKAYLTETELNLLEVDDEQFENMVIKVRGEKVEHNTKSANYVKQVLDHVKFFGTLFLSPNSDSLDSLALKAERKVFPWLSGYDAVFKTFKMSGKGQSAEINRQTTGSFVRSLQNNLKGTGIVITASDNRVNELNGLFSLLKLLGNKYPVQVIHKNDLSQSNMISLSKLALDPVMDLPEDWDASVYSRSKISTFEVTFVDVSKTIDINYKNYFNGFGMKLLALLFNSFEEMIMLDTDTVPLLPIKDFFNMDAHINTHAMFFRDREANSFLYPGVSEFFKSYLNSDYENHFLSLPKATEQTLNNRFFGDMARHHMEAGLFTLNKKEKFSGVMMSMTLQLMELFTGSLHGEKEMIWLGQEYTSNTYQFNTHGAVSVGELTPGRTELGLKSQELCSTHPGHLADDGKTLLWFNSGFLSCKKPGSWFKDVNYARNKGKSLDELKKDYSSPLVIKQALVPPPAEYKSEAFDDPKWNDSLKPKPIKGKKGRVNNALQQSKNASLAIDASDPNDSDDNNERKSLTQTLSINMDPQRSWIMTPHCSNYLWCAYDMGVGEIIQFEKSDTKKWELWGEVWTLYYSGPEADLEYDEDDWDEELRDEVKGKKKSKTTFESKVSDPALG
ncbi:alpha-1,3-mannosyltransferase [Martiniozyma asiatica (nom. inval.)]|nr:alpha-1,3-mannosyltransferase [Martiniozyma asiatica]